MENDLLMKTSNSSIMVLDGCPWPMLEKIPMDRNFSSLSRKHLGWMDVMLFLVNIICLLFIFIFKTHIFSYLFSFLFTQIRLEKFLLLFSGKVVKGMSVVRQVENTRTGAQDRPAQAVKIVDTHTAEVSEPYSVAKADASD